MIASRLCFKIALIGGLLTGLAGNMSAMNNVRKVIPAYESLRGIPAHIKALFPQIAAYGEIRWHQVLGVPADATEDQIRVASRRLQLRVHPDQGGQTANGAAFQAVQTALNESRGVAPDFQIIDDLGNSLPITTYDAVRDYALPSDLKQICTQFGYSDHQTEKLLKFMGYRIPFPSFDEYAAHFKNHYSLKGGVYGLALTAIIGKHVYEKYAKDSKKEASKEDVKKPQSKVDKFKALLASRGMKKTAKIMAGLAMVGSSYYPQVKYMPFFVIALYDDGIRRAATDFDGGKVCPGPDGRPGAYILNSEFEKARKIREVYLPISTWADRAEFWAGLSLILSGLKD